MKKRRVGIIGSICDKLDGQTIKTKILYSELKNLTDWDFYIANTQNKSKHPFKLLVQSIYMLIMCKDIFILVSQNGAKFYFPILYLATKFLKTRVFHDVIGGSPEDYVKMNPKNRKYLNSFIVNWVETRQMDKDLRKVGVTNGEYLPNFKRLNCLKLEKIKTEFSVPFSLCIFSRVMKEKGIEDAITAINNINEKYGKVVFKLDIYGSIDEGYEKRFKTLMGNVNDNIKYMGVVPYDRSVEVIKEYYGLLFPTFWFGEGFPGTIVDAFSAGLPIIATDFNVNKEIIENMKTGIVYPNAEIKILEDALEWILKNKSEFIGMRKNCILEAKKYQPESHIRTIIRKVENVNY